jgi:hypothetical protein
MSENKTEYQHNVLHNMSAPPRTFVTIKPLATPVRKQRKRTNNRLVHSSYGLYAIIGVNALLRTLFGDSINIIYNRGTLSEKERHLYLRYLIEAARVAVGEKQRPSKRAVYAMTAHKLEQLESLYINLTELLNKKITGLPPFALVRPSCKSLVLIKSIETRPEFALALISRIAGGIFSSGRTPVIPNDTLLLKCFYLYTFGNNSVRTSQ